MEEKKTEQTKLPWPSRLVNFSAGLLKCGLVIGLAGVPLLAFGAAGLAALLSCACVLSIASFCAIISFIGLAFYRFKTPGAGKAVLVMIICYPAVALGYAIVSPSFFAARTQAQTIICKSYLRQLNLGHLLYQEENGKWPNNNSWSDLLKPYLEDEFQHVFICPTDKAGPCSYAMNENIPADAETLPGDLVIFFESAPGWNQVGGANDVVTDRHKKPGANIALANGEVKFVPAGDIPTLRWTVENNIAERK